MTVQSPITVRAANVRDLASIWEIEEASYASPWPKETFVVDITLNADARYFVAVVGKRVVGFIGGWFKERHLHIVNVATHPTYRGRGVAHQLVSFLLDLAVDLKMESAFLEVRKSNATAQHLYEQLGFATTGLKPMYYPDDMEDGLVMSRELGDAHTGS